jgi:hypothetical protein
MRERLLKIIYWQPPEAIEDLRDFNKDVIEAAKNLVMMDLAILQVEIVTGMYKKPIETMAREVSLRSAAARSPNRHHRFLEAGRLVAAGRRGADGSGSFGCSVPAFRCTNRTASRIT